MKQKKYTALYQFQKLSEQGGNCEKCGKYCDKLNVDHIFPQSLLVMWGLKEVVYEDAENLWLVCRACNVLKAYRFDFHNPKTIPLIEKYIDLLKKTYQTSLLPTN